MKKQSFNAVIIASVFTSMPVIGGELSKNEVEDAFSGKTVNGYHHKGDFAFRRYYDPDGTLIAVSEKKGKRKGKWSVRDGKLCEDFGKNICNRVERDGNVIRKYNKKGGNIVSYSKFTDGNLL